MNGLKTFLLLAGLTALFVVIGGVLGGHIGMIIAVGFAIVMNMGAYWHSDKLVLKIYQAKPVDRSDSTGLYSIVESLANRANLPMPKVYVIESDSPNAFATGRNPQHASVAATTGLIQGLTRQELTGVMAHEMSHVKNRDTLTMAVTATISGAISGIANMFMWLSIFGASQEDENPIASILMMILAPIAAMLIQMAISRSREYAADKAGAELCGNPEWLASALEKLETLNQKTVNTSAQTHPATAHLFIINPLKGEKVAELFATHPVTAERIRRLRQMR